MTKIAIVVYSTWGHVLTLAKSELEGASSVAGVEVDLLQIPSNGENDASANANIPVATPELLEKYDGFLFGFPTRFGQAPAQFKAFFDATGGQWAKGAYHGKYAGFFFSTGTPGGGQETTARNTISQLVHHGMIFVPLGYAPAFADITSFDEVHGGSPWGSGALAAADGSRSVSALESRVAKTQGEYFAKTVARATGGLKSTGTAGTTGTATGTAAAGTAATGTAAGTAGTTSGAGAKSAPASANKSSAPTSSTSQTPESTAPVKESKPTEQIEKEVEEEKKQCCGFCTIM